MSIDEKHRELLRTYLIEKFDTSIVESIGGSIGFIVDFIPMGHLLSKISILKKIPFDEILKITGVMGISPSTWLAQSMSSTFEIITGNFKKGLAESESIEEIIVEICPHLYSSIELLCSKDGHQQAVKILITSIVPVKLMKSLCILAEKGLLGSESQKSILGIKEIKIKIPGYGYAYIGETLYAYIIGGKEIITDGDPVIETSDDSELFINCPNCGSSCHVDDLYCEECGHVLQTSPNTKNCPHCSAENEASALFCGKCGKDMTVVDTQLAVQNTPERGYRTRKQVATQMTPRQNCYNCQHKLMPPFRFCGRCGSKQPTGNEIP